MTQHATPASPIPAAAPARATTEPSAPPARARWTPARQRIFLAALLDSGSVAHAARAAGMSRSSAHRLRQRLAGTPFERTWEQALRLHADAPADPFAPSSRPAAPAAAPSARSSGRA